MGIHNFLKSQMRSDSDQRQKAALEAELSNPEVIRQNTQDGLYQAKLEVIQTHGQARFDKMFPQGDLEEGRGNQVFRPSERGLPYWGRISDIRPGRGGVWSETDVDAAKVQYVFEVSAPYAPEPIGGAVGYNRLATYWRSDKRGKNSRFLGFIHLVESGDDSGPGNDPAYIQEGAAFMPDEVLPFKLNASGELQLHPTHDHHQIDEFLGKYLFGELGQLVKTVIEDPGSSSRKRFQRTRFFGGEAVRAVTRGGLES